ncbi:hypothetical protein BDV93DRAFT_592123 [Ceratobasidium sp. AG-I]|nr:hypothetical protein BDV93DRAFT_592123 [Ceratobasidium sp. AG-I]
MHRHPYCIYLPLLLSKPGVLSSCIQLLREYTKQDGILDYEFGYLCLQVMALSVEVGILSQTQRLEAFIADVSKLPSQHTIARTLMKYLDPMTHTALSGKKGTDMCFLLGWEVRASDERFVALHQLGGVTIVDARFLVEILWDSRKDFLHAVQRAAGYVPGWSRLILVIWQSFIQHAYGNVPEKPSQQNWNYVTDLIARYSLFSAEHIDELMLAMLGKSQEIKHMHFGANAYSPTFVDVDDSEAVVASFCQARLKSTPPAHIIFTAMVFKYACINLHPSIFNARIPQLFAGVVERAWVQLEKAAQLNNRQLGNLSTFIEHFVQITILLMAKNRSNSASVFVALTDEAFFNYLGRIVLLPTFSPDRYLTGELKTNWDGLQVHMRMLCQWPPQSRVTAGFKLGPMTVLILDSAEHLVIYAVALERLWMELGEALGIRASSDQGSVDQVTLGIGWNCTTGHEGKGALSKK